jgi:branched-chain amino acid aminotransferase
LRDGRVITPPQTAGILDGINRRSIMRLAADLGIDVVERNLARAELYLAEEVFLSGTAAELVPVREIDDHTIGTGEPGPVTRELQRVFDDALHGRDPRYAEWLDVVQMPSRAGAG